ncbi:RNA polymerase sigma factor [Sphingopyxis sp. PAMC25046]|nr:RNA polymerase sigma factor [Sphingopyxis sp. PAMC25046]
MSAATRPSCGRNYPIFIPLSCSRNPAANDGTTSIRALSDLLQPYCEPVMSDGGLVQLFGELRPALARYLLARGASADEAEDILQDVHMKLLADDVGPVSQARAYLYRMTNNHFLMQRRTAGRRVRREEDWVQVNGGRDGEADERPSIENELIAREQLAILQRVLDDLPERSRIIFRRFRIDGEPQRRIAEELGISVSAVEKHLARAYEAIASARLRWSEDRPDRRHLTGERNRHAT